MKSPFKFLDSYTKDDREIFCGRDREIEELYQRVFDSKLMVVYGVSGTGKSSLIHCGLANKFQEPDWLPLVIRRGGNIIENTAASIKAASITPQKNKFTKPADFKKGVRSLYLDYYKPIFFIFDQFEELFIFGDKEERAEFVQIVKSLIESDLQCRLIFVMREEYMAGVTEFEKIIPTIFANRVRIEKMSNANALLAIEQPCKVFNISLEEGFAQSLLDRLSPEGADVELTYLQVFLDKIYRLSHSEKVKDTSDIQFKLSSLQKIGNVADLLGNFLEEQISLMDNPDHGLTVLKSFVSIKGTKRQMSSEEVSNYVQSLGKPIDKDDLHEMLQNFVQLRILQDKDQNDKYELRHDALAANIYEKITMVEKELLEIRQLIENAYHSWQKRGVLLSADDLQYIAPYEPRLFLPEAYGKLIEKSKYEQVKSRLRRRRLFSAAAVVLMLVLGSFSLWAIKERKNAIEKENIAQEERLKAKESEKEAIVARDIAIESDRIAVAMGEEASDARDRAEASEQRIKREKELAVIREIQTRANNYNYLSKEIAAEDPTAAFRLAEYALSLDPENNTILNNLKSIYYNNALYKVLFKSNFGTGGEISPDWSKIVTGYGRSAWICGLSGNDPKPLIGHLLNGYPMNGVHNFSRSGYDNIIDISISPDGKYILTGSVDKTARLWDMNGNCLSVLNGHALAVRAVSFSPDGNTLLTGSSDLTARLWDVQGKCLQIFTGHKDRLKSVVFSPDGSKILTGSEDSTAILWDLDGNVLQTLKGHNGNIQKVVFSHDGKMILTGSTDHTARLWDLNGNVLQVFNGHTGTVMDVAFSADDKEIATGSVDKTARLWDVYGNTIQILKGHNGSVYSVVFSLEDKSLLTFCSDGISRKWDISRTVYRNFIGHKDFVRTALFSPDGKSIMTLSGDKTIRFWDLEGNNYQTINSIAGSVALSPDGQSILTGLLTAQLLDLNGNPFKTFLGHMNGVSAVAFSPDGNKILTGSPDKTARIWNLNGETLAILSGHADLVNNVTFSPDGNFVLTGSQDKTARLWDLNGNTLQIFSGHSGYINSVAFSPDGQSVVTGSDDRTGRVWDLSGKTVQVLSGHSNWVNSVAFSPDGQSIITGSSDKTSRIWDLQGNTLRILQGYRSGILSVSYSPDGKYILIGSGDKIARLVNTKMPMARFMEENLSELLNKKQELKYGITEVSQLKYEKDTDQLFIGLEYCLAQAKLNDNSRDKFLQEANILIKKISANISNAIQGDQLIYDALELFRLNPQKNLMDIVKRMNEMLVLDCDPEELRLIYDIYSDYCNDPDSVKFRMELPEYFIQIAENVLSADTSMNKTISVDMAALTWPLIQNKYYESSQQAAMLALEADSTNQYIYATLPLVLLLNNRYDEAAAVYLDYKEKAMFNNMYGSYRNIYLRDIENLEKRGITHPDFARVKDLLKN